MNPIFALDRAGTGAACRVTAVVAPVEQPDWAQRLHEIGFIAGEPVCVTTRGIRGDPLVVRIGESTFALRRAEAACVQVEQA